MPRISELPKNAALSGLELLPMLQGGGADGNVGVPALALGNVPRGAVLILRKPMLADMAGTSDADPGAGNLRWNNATPASATMLYVDDVDGAAADLSAALAMLQPGGFVYIQGAANTAARDNWQKWTVTAITDATGYTKLAVTLVSSAGTFVDDAPLEVTVQQPNPAAGTDRSTVTAVTPSAGVATINCALGDYFTLALAANLTGWAFTNVPSGCSILVRITQDSTPRTVAWPASFRWVGGTDGVASTGSGAVDLLALSTLDGGTTWLATLANGFAA